MMYDIYLDSLMVTDEEKWFQAPYCSDFFVCEWKSVKLNSNIVDIRK